MLCAALLACVLHHVEHLLFCLPKEGQQPRQQREEADAQGPHVGLRAILPLQHLCIPRGGGGHSSCEGWDEGVGGALRRAGRREDAGMEVASS